tara:strand:- start:401 stop:682 length:282 start_codon:yes stop_codon:yes gene_type:complete
VLLLLVRRSRSCSFDVCREISPARDEKLKVLLIEDLSAAREVREPNAAGWTHQANSRCAGRGSTLRLGEFTMHGNSPRHPHRVALAGFSSGRS